MPSREDYDRQFDTGFVIDDDEDEMRHDPREDSAESVVDQIDAILEAYERGEELPPAPKVEGVKTEQVSVVLPGKTYRIYDDLSGGSVRIEIISQYRVILPRPMSIVVED